MHLRFILSSTNICPPKDYPGHHQVKQYKVIPGKCERKAGGKGTKAAGAEEKAIKERGLARGLARELLDRRSPRWRGNVGKSCLLQWPGKGLRKSNSPRRNCYWRPIPYWPASFNPKYMFDSIAVLHSTVPYTHVLLKHLALMTSPPHT